MVDQSVWRAGLPAPDYVRINQQVFNIIIHHTATSNTDTNYTDIVRNIYVNHTQVRGWSDIGYNYLIAPNGQIYKGRDPGSYDQDNVKGAHFCNANSGTMGISMMGTFTDTTPSKAALAALIDLTTWKLGKEHLDPLGTHWHSLNPNLPVIAGHRDGCATECPGGMLYALLDSIREAVWDKFKLCGFTVGLQNTSFKDGNIKILVRLDQLTISTETGALSNVTIIDLSGLVIFSKEISDNAREITLILPELRRGMYLLRVKTTSSLYTGKLLFGQ